MQFSPQFLCKEYIVLDMNTFYNKFKLMNIIKEYTNIFIIFICSINHLGPYTIYGITIFQRPQERVK